MATFGARSVSDRTSFQGFASQRMRILLLNQAFYPDVVSSGQHLTDLAVSLAQLGHDVTVIAAASGYDDPSRRFRRREIWQGINVVRIPAARLGKAKRWRRALNFASFLASCSVRLLTLGSFDVIVAMTSPPLISVLAALVVRLRGGRLVFWVMDLNPDEAIAAGWLTAGSYMSRLLENFLRFSLRRASKVVVLDRFMKDRVLTRGIDPAKLTTIPPWTHDDAVMFDAAAREGFRRLHGLADKFVVMYAGNHSPCHPLDTLLHAACELRTQETITFVFIGGGSSVEKVRRFAETHQLSNIVQVPYQPLSALAAALSAADLHIVTLGDPFVGIVHPCKIYNILRVGCPVLYIGPAESHVADLASRIPYGMIQSLRHGDVGGVVDCIVDAYRRWSPEQGRQSFGREYSKDALLPQLVTVITGKDTQRGTAPALTVKDSWQTN